MLWDLLQFLTIIYIVGPIFLFVTMTIFGLVMAKTLSNNPNALRPDGFDVRNVNEDGSLSAELPYSDDQTGIFTSLADGRAKVIERSGQGFVTIIMNYPGHTFMGLTRSGKHLKTDQPEYWKVVDITDHPGAKSLHPIGQWSFWSWYTIVFLTYRLAWWGWQRVVFWARSYVFVGLPEFWQIKIYKLEYFVSETDADGNLKLERHVSYSDHYRVAPFQFFTGIGSAETSSLLEVKAILSQLMWVNNPHKTAYATDNNWGSFITARFMSVATAVINRLSVENVVALDESATLFTNMKSAFKALVETGGALYKIGFCYEEDGLTLPDRSGKDDDLQKQLAGRAIAKIKADAERIRAGGDRDARITRAGGDARAVRINAKAVSRSGREGILVAELESRERVARAAGDKALIIQGNAPVSLDPAAAALLAEKKKESS